MQPLARAGRNLVQKGVGEILPRLSMIVLFVIAARGLGSADFGRFNYALNLAGLALVGMDLGLNLLLVREVARQPAELGRWLGSLLVIKLGLAGLVIAGLALALALLGDSQAGLVLAVTGMQALWGLCELGAAGLSAREAMGQEAAAKIAARLTALVLAGGLLWAGAGLWGLVAGLAAGNLVAALGCLGLARRLMPWRVTLDRQFLARLFRGGLPLALTGVFTLIYSRVDVIMLSALGRPWPEVGWYTAAVRVTDALGMLAGLVAAALLPVLSDLAGRRPVEFDALYRKGMTLALLVGLPAAAGLLAERAAITDLVYGGQYAMTASVFLWLAPCLALVFVNYLQLTALYALGRQRLTALAAGAALAVNIVLNWLLIPAWGHLAAAAATLACELVLLLVNAWFLRQAAGLPGPWRLAGRPAAATAAMSLFLLVQPGWGLGLVIPLAAAVYAGAALALGALRPADLRALAAGWRVRGGGAGGAA
ncbi:MAG: flippase [Thermodesulfobacteriota bacterium]